MRSIHVRGRWFYLANPLDELVEGVAYPLSMTRAATSSACYTQRQHSLLDPTSKEMEPVLSKARREALEHTHPP